MESSDYKISLDLHSSSAPVSLNTYQGDTGRRICVTLTERGQPYKIGSECEAVFAGEKPDGKILWNSCTIRDNTIIYEITPQTVAVVGWMPVQIRLYGEGGRLITTPDFVMLVNAPLVDDDAVIEESQNEISALTRLIADVIDLKQQLSGNVEDIVRKIIAEDPPQDGVTPHIGANGNWYLGDADTGKPSRGEAGYTPVKGKDYDDGKDGYTPVKNKDYFDGQDGTTPEFSVGTVETLEPEAEATATITGTKEKPVLNLGIPRGKSPENNGSNIEIDSTLSQQGKAADAAAVGTALQGKQPKGNYLTSETDPTVPDWAKQKNKPGYSKSEVGLGNVDNVKQYSASNPPPYPVTSVNGKTGAVVLNAEAVGARPDSWMPTADQVGARPNTWTPSASDVGAVPTSRTVNGKKLNANVTLTASDVGAMPSTYTPPDQTAEQVGADPKGTAAGLVSGHNTAEDAHNDIRLLIQELFTRLNALANSDDTTLDQMAEVVAYIKANRDLIEQITTGKVSTTDIVNNLTTNSATKPLSAAQGVALKALIDAITVPTKVSQLTNDSKFITASGAPVQSVNGETGAVQLTASKVGARSSSWMPTAAQVGAVPVARTVNGKALSADITLAAADVGARPDTWMPTAAEVGARPSTWTPTAADVGAVPTSRTVNGKALSADITLSASDVGARASDWMPTAANVGAVPDSQTIAVTGVDADGVSHSWTMYGVAQ